MKFLYPIIIVIVIITIVIFMITLKLFNKLFSRTTVTDDDIKKYVTRINNDDFSKLIYSGIDFFNKASKEDVSIISYDGLKLTGYLLRNNSNKLIILAHGFRSRCDYDFSVGGKDYYNRGFNILYINQRAHNGSEGDYITFGIKERYDLLEWIKYGDKYFDEIIVSGISMGASTVMYTLSLDIPPSVKGAICDCGYTTPFAISKYSIKNLYHIKVFSNFVTLLLSLVFKIKIGRSLNAIKHKKTMKKITTPILLVHGKSDSIVPFRMSEVNFKKIHSTKKLILVDNAEHGLSYLNDFRTYSYEIDDFLNKCLNVE